LKGQEAATRQLSWSYISVTAMQFFVLLTGFWVPSKKLKISRMIAFWD